MAQHVVDSPIQECDPASMICISAYAAYFLQEIVLMKTNNITSLESCLRSQAEQLFDTARKWTLYLVRDARPSLTNLQALAFGVSCVFLWKDSQNG
jgi:hypothetical protein